jgi:hypothetical protein
MSAAVLSRKKTAAQGAKSKTSARGLVIGEPDDSFEREANRFAAEAVSGKPEGPAWSISQMGIGAPLQRKCACGGTCDQCKEDEKKQQTLHRKPAGASRPGEVPEIVDEVLRSPGVPLDTATRDFFEARVHHNFGGVRIHSGGRAAESARAVDALAYTVGDHIVFGEGNYAPGGAAGRKLLAHELAHTVQQGTAAPRVVRRATPGWSNSATGSDNAAETKVGNIRRIPIEGLKTGNQKTSGGSTESAVGRAIVLLHKKFDATKPAKIFLFFHGWNEGYRKGPFGHRDKSLWSIETQLEKSGKEQVIGILPQGTKSSEFGDLPAGTTPPTCNKGQLTKAFNSDAYISEVFSTLISLNVWTASPTVDNVLIAGHSGAGELINQGLLGGGPGSSLPSKFGTLKEVALFDAINGPCEFVAVQDWLEATLKKELADLKTKTSLADQQTYLKTSMRFRSYYEQSTFYSQWNVGPLPSSPAALLAGREPLKTFLSNWFSKNATGIQAHADWEKNYAVEDMGNVAHDDNATNVMTGKTKGGSTPITESLDVLPKREPTAQPCATSEAPELVHEALQSPSRPLATPEKQWARAHFGHDFGNVRVHTDGKATESARAVKSMAYTVGRHIVFDPRRYEMETPGGRRLLGHELTHVLQQRALDPPSFRTSRIRISSPDDPLEKEADRHAIEPGPVTNPSRPSGNILQRGPAEGDLNKGMCEASKKAPKEQVGECNYRRPENCPTYESWIETFVRLASVSVRATTPDPGVVAAGTTHAFEVLGDKPATRFTGKAKKKDDPADPNAPPEPTTEIKTGEKFIDHPTDAWVTECLPPNLKATAYQLPADCADIAIILRHVWLSAHHRTQILRVDKDTWEIGDAKGGPGVRNALKAISDIGSQTVTSLVAPYSDKEGHALVSFADLAPLLHPGDILVWEHRDNGLDKGRTGGHTHTITAVNRDQNGKILSMSFLQGNEPIFGDRCDPKQPDPGGLCAAADDKGKIIKELKVADTDKIREELGHAPGRRIETATTEGPSANGMSMNNPDLDVPTGKKGETKKVWGWEKTTILLAAGPPQAVPRPAMAPAAKGAKPETHLNDWVKSFKGAGTDADWQAAWEGMLLEARAFIEQGLDIPEDEARQTGEAAGNKFWTLAKQPKGTLGDETHFRRLDMAQRALQFVATSRKPSGADPKSAQNQITAKLKKTLDWIGDSFELAGRGASDISFGKADKSVVKVLMTGFDPFAPSGDQSMPAKGVWNPSGAAILAMDNTEVSAKSSAGTAGTARVQGIILPVSYDRFNAGGKGLLETIVTSKAADIDAAITVSMESNVSAARPVRLEQFVVGTEAVVESGPKGPSSKLQPVPAAGGGGAGEGILESNAPLGQIAGDTEQKAKDAEKDIQKPDIGREIRFRFATDDEAKTALAALGGRRGTSREVLVSDEAILHEITKTMVRQANGIDIKFKVGGKDFTAAVVEGPGGNFLSNEVSYRMLRLLKQKSLPQDPLSFHVHTQNPELHENDDPSKRSAADSLSAAGFMNRLVATLKRIVAATAKVILDRRGPKKP